jgi:GT2 family glycosyltransferase
MYQVRGSPLFEVVQAGTGQDASSGRAPRRVSGFRIVRATESGGRPRVTVVVPCYNYGHYLPQCLASVLEQPGVSVDALVIDDASTDDSRAVAEGIAARDPRVTVVAHARNQGHIATYNDGLARATGTYVVVLSADDELADGALRRATALMEAYPSVGFVYGRAVCFEGADRPPVRPGNGWWALWSGERWARRRWETGRNCIWSPEVVMRTAVQHQIGGYRSSLPHTGDFDMWMRAARVADVGYVIGADQAFYRFHGDNMHQSSFDGGTAAGVVVDLSERRRAFELLATETSSALLLARARRALANEALKAVVHAQAAPQPQAIDELVRFAADTDPAGGASLWRRAARCIREHGTGWGARHPAVLAGVATIGARDVARRRYWEYFGA